MVIGMLFFAACEPQLGDQHQQDKGTGNIAPVKIDLEKIMDRGYLTAVVDYSSTSYFVYKGELMGFEYELLQRVKNYLGVEVRIVVEPSILEAIRMLNRGEADIMAYPLTITKERKKVIAFTRHYSTQRQVLVQKKPDPWRDMKLHEIEKTLVRNQVDLIGAKIHVLNHSSYIDALEALSDQIGGDIEIIEDSVTVDTEELIRRVAIGQYRYTVSDENIAYVNKAYYPILDIQTPVSFPRRVAWAVRLNSPELLDTLNKGLRIIKSGPVFNNIYNKYFRSSREVRIFARSEYSSFSGQKLSPYDELIKQYAEELGWDWRFYASMIYQESKFDPGATSWVGAQGLLQLMSSTARHYGIRDRTDPKQSLKGGTAFLKWLQNYWKGKINDKDEQQRFVLASYNVGIGHIQDAQALTRKYGGNEKSWHDVTIYLKKLSNKAFYNDEVVKLGYARGTEPVNYVHEIYARFSTYKQLIP